MKRNDLIKGPVPMEPWIPDEKPQGCNHTFSLSLYVPPGQKAIIKCPYCGHEIVITGSGAIC
jgi:DNA-directed RNA polymerase subunit RPC12/RpoP